MDTWNAETICTLLREAGRIAVERRADLNVSTKPNDTIVTDADIEIERVLAAHLEDEVRGVYVLGEETVYGRTASYFSRALTETAWVLDPIDGTVPFTAGLPTWGISIGLMKHGTLVDGAIYLPDSGIVYVTSGRGVLTGIMAPADDAVRLTPAVKPTPHRPGIVTVSQTIAKSGVYDGPASVHSIGSCVFSIVGLLAGWYLGYTAKVRLWDIAGGIPLLDKLGFSMKFATGVDLGCAVTSGAYVLTHGSPDSLKIPEHVFLAPDDESCAALIAACHESKPGTFDASDE